MNSVEFLDAVRAKHDIPSYTKLGVFLGIPNGHMSQYTTGKRKLAPRDCEKVAEALEVDPGYVMAAIQAERAKRKNEREVWLRVAQLVKKSHAAMLPLLLVCAGLFSQPADAAGLSQRADNIHYAHMLRRLARWFRRLHHWPCASCTAVAA